MSKNGPAVTFGQVIAIAPDKEALDNTIKAKLDENWGEMPAIKIGALTIYTLAHELLVILPDPDYNNNVRFQVAQAVNELLQGFKLTPEVQQPQQIKVIFDKTPEQMSLRELLEALIVQPDRYSELRPFIEEDRQIRAATRKSNGAWVIVGTTGLFDVEQTMAYVARLSKPFASAQREFTGQRPVTLASALSIDDRALIHPFTWRPVQGPDENGFDLSTLDPELHEALLWAVFIGHSAWPRQINDLYAYTEEVLTTPLSRRWQRILEDYQYAKRSGDDTVRLISRFWPEHLSFDEVLNPANTDQRRSTGSSTNYQQKLLDVAQAMCHQSGMGARVNGGVYRRINISGMDATVDNVIVLEGGRVTGIGVRGTIYAPPGVSLNVSGMDASVRVINLSWEDLARRAHLI